MRPSLTRWRDVQPFPAGEKRYTMDHSTRVLSDNVTHGNATFDQLCVMFPIFFYLNCDITE